MSGDDNTWIYGEGLEEGEFQRIRSRRYEFVANNSSLIADGYGPSCVYDPEQRPPYKQDFFTIEYRDGGIVAGKAYNDQFCFLHRGSPRGRIYLTFGVATLANSTMLKQDNAEGVLGLGYSKADLLSREGCVEPFVGEVAKQYCLKKIIFWLKFHNIPPNNLGFGPPPTPLPFERWEDVDITKQFWEVPFYKIGVVVHGEWKLIKLSDDVNITINAHIDCGSTLCYIPKHKLEQLYSLVGGFWVEGGWCLPRNKTLPEIGLLLGETWLRLPGSFLKFWHENAEWDHGAIQSHSETSRRAVLGSAFFRHVDVYFDSNSAEPKIGFDDRKRRRRS